uniref:ATP synthase complex subunit 8 n=1 Tax=Bradysia impatiens TaxID=335710 RepID=A0A8F2YW00_9DIPT|nr:ATP synthase F0 subunit 8 [Bradysia impatiens]
MSPINWLSLFFTFCLTFLMFNLMNYFSFNLKSYKPLKNNYSNKNKMKFSWKW